MSLCLIIEALGFFSFLIMQKKWLDYESDVSDTGDEIFLLNRRYQAAPQNAPPIRPRTNQHTEHSPTNSNRSNPRSPGNLSLGGRSIGNNNNS